jgi:2'-phosphotransferase
MTFLLRHGAEREQVPMEQSGFIAVTNVLEWLNRSAGVPFTEDEVRQVVASCPKQRFLLEDRADGGGAFIRANQGHSLMQIDVEMEQVLDASEVRASIKQITQRLTRTLCGSR